ADEPPAVGEEDAALGEPADEGVRVLLRRHGGDARARVEGERPGGALEGIAEPAQQRDGADAEVERGAGEREGGEVADGGVLEDAEGQGDRVIEGSDHRVIGPKKTDDPMIRSPDDPIRGSVVWTRPAARP